MALIPSFFLDCVVAIGIGDTPAELKWIASGFLYGHFKEKIDEKVKKKDKKKDEEKKE